MEKVPSPLLVLAVQRLRELVPSRVQVTVLADRDFADAKFYALLK